MNVKLEKNKKRSLMSKVTEINPSYVCFEIPDDYDILVNIDEEVKKNQILANCSYNTSIVSSVAGKIVECGKLIKIENNYTESKELVDVTNMNKEKFIKLLKDSGIVGMSGAGFPTYKKYDVDRIDTLIVNAVECEPYITSDYTIIKLHAKEIIEAIEKIMEINNIKETIIAVEKNNNKIKNFFDNYTTAKIKVKEVKDVFSSGWERKIIKQVKNIEYDKLPIEKNIITNNVSTIFAIKRLLDGKRLDARMVTITGDIDSSNYLVKIGTSIFHLIKDLNLENKDVIIGGPMMGTIYKDEYITPKTNCILIINKTKEKESPCIRCGKCIQICPVKLEPVLIKDNIDDIEKLKNLRVQKCMECGLCSYICPSKIKLRDKIIEAKRR